MSENLIDIISLGTINGDRFVRMSLPTGVAPIIFHSSKIFLIEFIYDLNILSPLPLHLGLTAGMLFSLKAPKQKPPKETAFLYLVSLPNSKK